jgi:aryl-alcohol dehydrogenase-like predicted oxidoreductase
MNEKKHSTDRRDFLKTGIGISSLIALGGAAPGFVRGAEQGEEAGESSQRVLPRRKLGKNGPEVTILNLGGMMSAHNPQYLDVAWQLGIRYFDTADCYKGGKSEEDIGTWITKYPERRKDLFLVTKDHPRKGPAQLIGQLDRRLEKLKTDYVDLFFIHGLSARSYGEDAVNWVKGDGELKEVFKKIKASGKAKMCGFSCHDGKLVDFLNAAAEGGFVDAIMLRYNPFMEKDGDLDQALDACHKAGIGLISMKEMKPFAKAPKKQPELEKVGLTTHQALLHAVWSDPRIASICSSMDNLGQLDENTLAASVFKDPLPEVQRKALREVAALTPAPMCPGCPHCEKMVAQTQYAFYDIARYVTYYEQDGDSGAREMYQDLPVGMRTASPAELYALREGCDFNVDYPEIARRADNYFIS